jgi:hypothetical protein
MSLDEMRAKDEQDMFDARIVSVPWRSSTQRQRDRAVGEEGEANEAPETHGVAAGPAAYIAAIKYEPLERGRGWPDAARRQHDRDVRRAVGYLL